MLLLHIGIMVHPFGDAVDYRLMAGPAAVMVFFVLSGIVLSLAPFRRMREGNTYDWLGYFPRRVARLCIPLFCAVAVGILAGYVSWRLGLSSRSALAIDRGAGPDQILRGIFMQFDFLFNVSDDHATLSGLPLVRVNSPVWSMSWEIWFSLTLPLAIWAVSCVRRAGLFAVVLTGAVFLSHVSGYFPLRLCLMFWVGVLLARRFDRLSSLRFPPAAEVAVMIAALAAIEIAAVSSLTGAAQAVLLTVRDAACTLVVIVCVSDGAVRRLLSRAFFQYLGRISYSLYLTHAILIGALGSLLPRLGMSDPLLIGLACLVLSFALAEAFYRLVEAPSIRLSRNLQRSYSAAA